MSGTRSYGEFQHSNFLLLIPYLNLNSLIKCNVHSFTVSNFFFFGLDFKILVRLTFPGLKTLERLGIRGDLISFFKINNDFIELNEWTPSAVLGQPNQ